MPRRAFPGSCTVWHSECVCVNFPLFVIETKDKGQKTRNCWSVIIVSWLISGEGQIMGRWGLGPAFWYEWLMTSRRWQLYAGRALVIAFLLAALGIVWWSQ